MRAGCRCAAPTRWPTWPGDTLAVLDALGIAQAHIVGASMGGMIAQHIAASQPQRVSKLTLMMTTSGARHLPKPSMKARAAMMDRRGLDPRNVDAVVDRLEHVFTVIGSPMYRPERAAFRARLRASVERAYRPDRRGTATAGGGGRRRPLADCWPASPHPRTSFTARRIPSCPWRQRMICTPRSKARRSKSSTAWATTCRRNCGRGWRRRWRASDVQRQCAGRHEQPAFVSVGSANA